MSIHQGRPSMLHSIEESDQEELSISVIEKVEVDQGRPIVVQSPSR